MRGKVPWQGPAWWPPVLPPSECYLLMPVLWTMAGGWVRTPVLFLAVCGPKYTELSLYRSVRSLQGLFPIDDVLLLSGDIRDQVAKVSEIEPKFHVFWPPNFSRKRPPNFWPNSINLGHHRTLVPVGHATSEIRRRKKNTKSKRQR